MLERLSIKNIGLVENIELEYEQGATVFTGETGAGKSMLLNAILLLLGEKSRADIVRKSSDGSALVAEVSAQWYIKDNPQLLQWLEEYAFECENHVLITRRIIKDGGRAQCFIQGTSVPLRQLSECAQYLCEIHTQHEHQNLFKAKEQCFILDSYAGITDLQSEFSQHLKKYKKKKNEWKTWRENTAKLEKKITDLKYAVEEIETLELKKEEDTQLTNDLQDFSQKERIINLWANFDKALNTTDNVADTRNSSADTKTAQTLLQAALAHLKELESISSSGKTLSKTIKRFESLIIELDDIIVESSSIRSNFTNVDSAHITQIEARLAEIELVKKKYGPHLSDVFEYLENSKKELENITSSRTSLHNALEELKEESKIIRKKAEVLHQKRLDASQTFSQQMNELLHQLAMTSANFRVDVQAEEDKNMNSTGLDTIVFMITTNKGEYHKPISKIASGGELSRIMLAIRVMASVFDNSSPSKNNTTNENVHSKLLVLDEVDAGIGGKTAQVVAQYLRDLSKRVQIVCVSHLATIAACTHNHYLVYKREENERTFIQAKKLHSKERVTELARMIVGDEEDTLAQEQAKKMLHTFNTQSIL